jgi:hypothetical protein
VGVAEQILVQLSIHAQHHFLHFASSSRIECETEANYCKGKLSAAGIIEIKRALKRSARKCTVRIAENLAAVLRKLKDESRCEYAFTSCEDHTRKLTANTLANQHRIIKKKCTFHFDAGLNALRNTFLTEAARCSQNVKALQQLAGRSRIETRMKYIDPDQRDQMEIARAVQQARSRKKWCTAVFTKVESGENVVASKLQ